MLRHLGRRGLALFALMVLVAFGIADAIVGRDDRWPWLLVAAVPALVMLLIPDPRREAGRPLDDDGNDPPQAG